jgi:hypothetical protein
VGRLERSSTGYKDGDVISAGRARIIARLLADDRVHDAVVRPRIREVRARVLEAARARPRDGA